MSELKVDERRVEAREIDGELVIYDMSARRYLGGNGSAAMLWPLVLEGTDIDSLAAALEAGYGIDAEAARADAGTFVASLRDHGLLGGE